MLPFFTSFIFQTTVYEADVVHIPLSVACMSPNLFFLPSFTSLFPLLDADLLPIRNYMQANVSSKDVYSSSWQHCHHSRAAWFSEENIMFLK